jgi:serine/threonine protein kinase
MYQLIEAIQYMQTCGVVHRDLKPENILVEKDSRTEEVI